MYPILIGITKETIPYKVGASVGDETVAFHLSHPQPSVAGSTLEGLTGQHRHGPSRAGVHLVVDEMLETLVERRTDEDSGVERTAGVSLIHGLVAVTLISHGMETHTDILDGHVREGGGVALAPLEYDDLAEETFDQLSDGHSGGDGVRIHDDVGDDPLGREGHVFLSVGHTDRSLLSVPRCKFVPDLGDANVPNPNLGEPIPLLRGAEQHVINDTVLVGLHGRRTIPLGVPAGHTRRRIHGSRLTDEYVVPAHPRPRLDQSIPVELGVFPVLHTATAVHRRLLERLGRERSDRTHRRRLLLIDVASIIRRTEQSAIDRALIHNERILLIVSRIDHDADDDVHSRGQFAKVEEFHGPGGAQRLLGIVEDVGHGIHTDLIIRRVNAHGLLSHGALVRITRTLIVIGKGYDRRADSQYHGGMNLAVRVRRRIRRARIEIFRFHRDHGRLLLLGIDVFDQTLHE
mmetsp:Transcript_38401/g.115055  ORF Transcript_38401/g.115055 Transcript_38401/m.115055 type:complete len:461 (-) Transcript_38401:2045-3427(-)